MSNAIRLCICLPNSLFRCGTTSARTIAKHLRTVLVCPFTTHISYPTEKILSLHRSFRNHLFSSRHMHVPPYRNRRKCSIAYESSAIPALHSGLQTSVPNVKSGTIRNETRNTHYYCHVVRTASKLLSGGWNNTTKLPTRPTATTKTRTNSYGTRTVHVRLHKLARHYYVQHKNRYRNHVGVPRYANSCEQKIPKYEAQSGNNRTHASTRIFHLQKYPLHVQTLSIRITLLAKLRALHA